MRFISSGIGQKLSAKLADAEHLCVASAFFSPSEALLSQLQGLPHLDLLISEEFTVNDPYKLSQLNRASLRSVPTDAAKGKLHAKVFIAKLKDGSRWLLLGSANLTQQGLFANQEACIEMHSSNKEDEAEIDRIKFWFDGLFGNAHPIDLTAAKAVYDQRSRYRLEPRPADAQVIPSQCWAIKTTSGGADAEEHWPRLLSDSVVAIGWEDLAVDPSQVDDAQLRLSLSQFLDPDKPGQIDFGVRTIRNFINMPIGSIVVLCRGLVPNQTKPVHIYAFARVVGPFRAEPRDGTHWRFKRDAVIQEVGTALPAAAFAMAVDKQSFRQTMHQISAKAVQRLADDLGVRVEV